MQGKGELRILVRASVRVKVGLKLLDKSLGARAKAKTTARANMKGDGWMYWCESE